MTEGRNKGQSIHLMPPFYFIAGAWKAVNGDAYPVRVSQKVTKKLPVSLYVPTSGFKASAHSFKSFTSRLLKVSFSLSMYLLPRMNVMLDFIWTLPVQLLGTRNKWTLQILIHGRIRTTNTAPLAFQRVALTTRLSGQLTTWDYNYLHSDTIRTLCGMQRDIKNMKIK